MALLREEDRRYLIEYFEKNLVKPVKIVYFTQELNCDYCTDTEMIYREVESLSPKIELEIHNFVNEKELADKYGIDKIPGTAVVTDEKDYGVRFFGIPSGYEFMSLVEALSIVSKGETDLSPKTKETLKKITIPMHMEVMITPTCPYCPRAVMLAHKFAVESDMVRADMVEATEFPGLSDNYGVYAVPKTIVNGEPERCGVEGALPEHEYLEFLMDCVRELSEIEKNIP